MAIIVLRSVKGSELTNNEVDANFTNLNNELGTTAKLSGNNSYTGTNSYSQTITSTVPNGTAPFIVASSTNIPNLNASSLNGATFASPGNIGTGTPGSGNFTTITAGSINGALTGSATGLAGLNSNGIAVRTSSTAFTARSIAGSGTDITVQNGDGVSGNPTILTGTNIPKKNTANIYTQKNTFGEISAYGFTNDDYGNLFFGFDRTSGTDELGLPYIPSLTGAPTGTPPVSKTFYAPITWDSGNKKLWIYSGGVWNGAGGEGVVNPTPDTLVQRSSTGQVNATGFNTLSDIRLKGDILDLENSLEKILAISGKSYFFKNNKERREFGFIAQEVEKVIPEIVHGEGIKTINYQSVIPILVEAIKTLSKRIEDLESK